MAKQEIKFIPYRSFFLTSAKLDELVDLAIILGDEGEGHLLIFVFFKLTAGYMLPILSLNY
jgi:hypothetical protein